MTEEELQAKVAEQCIGELLLVSAVDDNGNEVPQIEPTA